MLCWSCAKEYARQKDGIWNPVQRQYVCAVCKQDGRVCNGMLVSKKIFDEEMKKISDAGLKSAKAGAEMRNILLPIKKTSE
jgi:hypothetical protein